MDCHPIVHWDSYAVWAWLRVLDTFEPGVWKLRWRSCGELQGSEYSNDDISKLITSQILKEDHMILCKNPNNADGYRKFIQFVKRQNGNHDLRRYYDFTASLSALDEKGEVAETKFRFVTGSATLFSTTRQLNNHIREHPKRVLLLCFKLGIILITKILSIGIQYRIKGHMPSL